MLDRETKDFITAHRNEDPRALALQAKRYPAVDMREAVTQIEGWQAAKDKLPAWAAVEGIIYPPRISMEQCSSEVTALYKASLVCGERIADLTGGFGIDCSYMSRGFAEATYIERNERLCDIAKENFALLGLKHIRVLNGNSEDCLAALPKQDWIFIDPARRDTVGRKVVALEECEPNVVALEHLLLRQSGKVMVKCSPMLDVTAAMRRLESVSEVHIVAVNGECKELLLVLGGTGSSVPIHCVNLVAGSEQRFTFTAEGEAAAEAKYSDAVGKYLYEPHAAIQKGGCYRSLSAAFGVGKLHPNSQLYTSDTCHPSFPGRRFKVEWFCGFSKAELKRVQELGRANITVRNFPESVQQLRKRLKLADGGELYIFATTLRSSERVLVVCSRCIE